MGSKLVITKMVIVIIFSLTSLYSQVPFTIARFGTDYNGVIEANGRIIAYGKYGVITFSDDFGVHWRQVNLGEFFDILKMIKDDVGTLYALTRNSIFISNDNGTSWKQMEIVSGDDLVDFSIKGNKIYAISRDKIYIFDNEFNSPVQIFLQFDDFMYFSKCAIISKYLFIVNLDFFIYRIDLESKQIDTIDIREKYNLGNDYKGITTLKVIGNELYILLETSIATQFETQYINQRHLVLRSSYFGGSWDLVTNKLPVTIDLIIDSDGAISTLAPLLIRSFDLQNYVSVSYVKIRDNEIEEHIQKNLPLLWFPYYSALEEVPFEYKINSITKINNDIIIAVGNYKTILISRDDGISWEMVSFFRPLFGGEFYCLINKADTIVVLTSEKPNMFISTDGGVTFIPIQRDQWFEINKTLSSEVPFSYPNGKFGFFGLLSSSGKRTDTLGIIVSNDFGKNFYCLKYPLGTSLINDSVLPFFENRFYIAEKDYYLLNLKFHTIYSEHSGPRNIFCIIDTNFLLVDTIMIDYYFTYLKPFKDGIVMLDTIGIYISSDFGRTKTLLANFPKKMYHKNNYDYLSYSFIQIFQDKALIQESSPSSYQLLIYDLKENYYDSIPLPKFFHSSFVANDTVFISFSDSLWYFPDIVRNYNNYYSIPVNQILASNFKPFSSFKLGDSSYLWLFSKSLGSVFVSTWELDFGKIIYQTYYQKVEPNVEENFVYLYAYPPYPNPVNNFFYIKLYWDIRFNKDDIKISILDIDGKKVNIFTINFLQGNSFNGLLEIDCKDLPSGIYFVQITLGNKSISVPFAVAK